MIKIPTYLKPYLKIKKTKTGYSFSVKMKTEKEFVGFLIHHVDEFLEQWFKVRTRHYNKKFPKHIWKKNGHD